MPTYSFLCTSCNSQFDELLSFSEHDECKLNDDTFCIKCPNCTNMLAKRTFDECAHGHVINSNVVGVYAEKNAKKVGKTKIEESEAKYKEALKPKGKEPWYGKLSEEEKKSIFDRKSKVDRQKAVQDYILNG